MDPTITPAELAAAADPDTFGRYLAGIKPHGHMDHHPGRSSSVRTAEYEGHRIRIVTTYDITVDDRPLPAELDVDDDGMLTCHGLPTYQFLSAMDTVKALIRHFPDHFGMGD
ncbi:hypothetical protein [Streptomyces sp. FH025]|uniref:hypothetical protein n=1 Tax=Streptomyces sp. FH025 TaxID=2815937 RepID=UPI001A9DBB86|nr:hypothetical protein [Streptomyces sp. FH025]MBO1414327.1 hypothetical protein [Streptomyces sp. FH025]